MFDIELMNPWFLLLLFLLPVLARLLNRPAAAVTYSSVALVSHLPKSLRQRISKLPLILLLLAFTSLIIALARPRSPISETRVSRDGIAIMMVVDRSSSMNARDLVEDDLGVNRLDVVKDVFVDFVLGDPDSKTSGRPDDLVGLVTFAGYADSVCPLTLDHGNLANIASELQIVDQRTEDGTAIGDGLGLAVERLRRSTAKSRVVILLTDGVNNAGVIPPERAAELAAEYDVKVYCIGAGTKGLAPVPVQDMFGRTQLMQQQADIDEETLKKIASQTGGEYFRAQNRAGLLEIYGEIDNLERTEVAEVRYLRYTEHFPAVVALTLGLMSLAALTSSTVFRRLP